MLIGTINWGTEEWEETMNINNLATEERESHSDNHMETKMHLHDLLECWEITHVEPHHQERPNSSSSARMCQCIERNDMLINQVEVNSFIIHMWAFHLKSYLQSFYSALDTEVGPSSTEAKSTRPSLNMLTVSGTDKWESRQILFPSTWLFPIKKKFWDYLTEEVMLFLGSKMSRHFLGK